MKAKTIISLIVAAGGALAAAAQPVSLRIVGEVDTVLHYTRLAIVRQNDRIDNVSAEFPVTEGKVDYVFETAEPDRFELFAIEDLYNRGSWMPMAFMAENGEIRFSSESDERMLKMTMENATGHLNKQLMAYKEHDNQIYKPRRDSIFDAMNQIPHEDQLTPEAKALFDDLYAVFGLMKEYPDSLALEERRNDIYHQLEKLRDERKKNTPEYYVLEDAYLALSREQFEEDMQTYGASDCGYFGLSQLIESIGRQELGSDALESVVDAYITHYKAPYANTIMGQRMDKLVTGYEISHIGGRYPNYSLPDAEGNEHQIKDLIDGKLVLIDLWGSTCSPCRTNSMSMKPIYEDYKDKGFEIIGIAREYGNLDRFYKAVEKDGYPWMQLIELDDAHGIFQLHGIPTAMGGTFLVSPEGRILRKSPTP
ncbi:MAG: TlpA family protein disulfide reductase, partial [Muribaculaceae bacterium]|nr:TlpA family protein disulfide reductase [Muribaculaceae bacterium]